MTIRVQSEKFAAACSNAGALSTRTADASGSRYPFDPGD